MVFAHQEGILEKKKSAGLNFKKYVPPNWDFGKWGSSFRAERSIYRFDIPRNLPPTYSSG